MENNLKRNYISDKEFNTFLERDYVEALEQDLKETPTGQRVLMLQKLGLDISLKILAKKYISKAGYTMQPTGQIYIQEDMMKQVFSVEEMRLSEELNIDISKINDPQKIQRIMAENNYKASVERIGVDATIDWFNLSEDFKKEVSDPTIGDILQPILEKLDYSEMNKFNSIFDEFVKTDELEKLLRNNEFLSMNDAEINEIIDSVEKDTVDYHINNKETSELMRLLYQLREADKNRNEDEDAYQTKVAEIKEKVKSLTGNMQYEQEVLDANGELDTDKALSFLTDWENTRNETKLFDNLTKILGTDYGNHTPSKLPKVIVLLAQATKGNNQKNKKIALSIAQSILKGMNYNLLDENGNLNVDVLNEKYKEILGEDADLYQVMLDNEWNEHTANDKLDRVDGNIDKQHGIIPLTRDDVNDSKEAYNKLLDRVKTEKKESFAKIVEENNLSKEQIIALFYEYRKKETVKSQSDLLNFGPRQLMSAKDHGTAQIILDYMCEHKEEFQEYFSEKGCLLGSKINGTVLTYDYTEEDIEKLKSSTLIIDTQFTTISSKIEVHKEVTKELGDLIESFIGTHKDEISQEDKDLIFSKAAILAQKGELSKFMIQHLLRIDSDRYANEIKGLRGEDFIEDVQESVANTILALGKMVASIPKRILNLEEHEQGKNVDEKTKGFFKRLFSRDRQEENTKSEEKGFGKFFKNLISKNKPKQLPEAITQEQPDAGKISQQVNHDQNTFDINQRHNIDHKKAIEQTNIAKDEIIKDSQVSVEDQEKE